MSAKLQTQRVYSKVWGRKGVLGVNGGNFHAILVIRELIETGFQTQQAYRMSWYLPRLLLNRFYLFLLVLNCWSSVFICSLLFKKMSRAGGLRVWYATAFSTWCPAWASR